MNSQYKVGDVLLIRDGVYIVAVPVHEGIGFLPLMKGDNGDFK